MNKVYISLASVLLLQGCEAETPPSDDEILKYIDQRTTELNQKQLNSESAELEQIKKQLQEKDPSVTDVYYTYEGDEKQLHVVSSKDDGETGDFVWPLVGGLAAGYLVGQMLSSSNSVHDYASRNPPARYNAYPSAAHWQRKAEEDKKNYAGYTYTHLNNQMRSNPQVRSSASKVIISTRSQNILNNNAARANSGTVSSQPASTQTRSNAIFSGGSTSARAVSISSSSGG